MATAATGGIPDAPEGAVLVQGGTVVSREGTGAADILIRGSRIEMVGRSLSAPGARRIDARGLVVVPGGVDVHTHLGVGSDDWRTGTVAAACGGTTTVVDHPGFGPAGCPLSRQIAESRRLADGVSAVDYGLHAVVQHVDDAVLEALPDLLHAGISSLKLYMTYDFRLEDAAIARLLSRAAEEGLLVAAHCEDHATITGLRERFAREGNLSPRFHALSRPPEAEAAAIRRLASLAGAAGSPTLYVVHLSSEAGLAEVRRARDRGLPVIAETCPQYLLLDEELYDEPDGDGLKYVMSPPLRRRADREALWKALAGGEISVVATDHCPFFLSDKKKRAAGSFLRCPNGAPGIETRMAILYAEGVVAGRLTLRRYVEVTATEPARIMGLYPNKGVIAPGSDADLLFLDPRRTVRIEASSLHQRCDYTPFEGMEAAGVPALTMLRGRLIAEDGRFTGGVGGGAFLERRNHGT